MPKYFTHFTFLFFLLVGISGLWMRIFPFYPNQRIPYENLLHGHSHLAFLGWVFLGMFIIFLKLYWPYITEKKQVTAMTLTLITTTLIMFIAFLYEGYGVFSIIMATAHIFVEYWIAFFIYKQIKKIKEAPKIGTLYMKGALLALIISSISPFLLGFIAANSLQDTAIFEMAIYFYLHFQYNGWFFLFLIGLYIVILQRNKIRMNDKLLSTAFWLYFIMLLPGYFHSILWASVSNLYAVLSAVGSIGQWLAIVMILLAFKPTWKHIRTKFSRQTLTSLVIVFTILFLKHTLELGLIIPKLASLVYETRSVVIGYLHFTLLGFVSLFLLIQFKSVQIFNENKYFKMGIIIFFIGFLLNETLLFTKGLAEWLDFSTFPLYFIGLTLASSLLLISITILWIGYFRKV